MFVFERAGKCAIPMLIFAGIPFLFAGPIIGVICWLLAAALIMALYTSLRGRLGIPPAKSSLSTQAFEPGSTVVRVRNSKRVTNIGNIGYDTDSAVDAENVEDLHNEDNRILRTPEASKKNPDARDRR
jgi:hypothetical protein